MSDMHPEKAARRAAYRSGPPIDRNDLDELVGDARAAFDLLAYLYWELIPNNTTHDHARADDDLDLRLTAQEYSMLRMGVITATDKMKALVDAYDLASSVE